MPSSVPSEHKELFRAARALLKHGVSDEHEIIPTLVFAALSDEASGFVEVRRRFAEAGDDDEVWRELREQWHTTFADLWVVRPLLDGVPVIHLKNFMIQPYPEEQGSKVVGKIVIEAYHRKDTPEDLERVYGECLTENSIPYDDTQGGFSWWALRGRLRMVIRPEDADAHPIRQYEVPTNQGVAQQLSFPSPVVVKEMYNLLYSTALLRDPAKEVLVGRERGASGRPAREADVLIPACVAWYASGRGAAANHSEQKRKLGKLLEDNLPLPWDNGALSGSPQHGVWQRIESPVFVSFVRRIEEQLNSRGWLLDKYF